MNFAQRMSRITTSSTMVVLQKAQKLKAAGVEVVDFGAGEPDFPTPENIKQAAVRALEENFTKYTATGGIRELKEAICRRHAQDFGSNYTPEECLVTVGGKQAIFEAISALIEHGDEVILPSPYWVSFMDIIHYAGGKGVLVEACESEDFVLRAEQVERALTPQTKLIVVNSPNNPTGAVVEPQEMEKLLALAKKRNLVLLSDECYCQFLYDGRRPFSLGASGNRENLVLVGSLSKTYSMTGWRVGFALGPAKLMSHMLNLQSHSTSNPTSIAQKAAVEALLGPQDSVQAMLQEYSRRRDKIVQGLRSIPGIRCSLPQGAFYVYPNVGTHLGPKGAADVLALAEKLLEQAHLALVPGTAFGTDAHVRISYAASQKLIDEGLRRLRDFFTRS
ncbi:MAG: pyridoxal phosphate-dependent aminotransferase [Acidobacteriota bacterium]